MARVRVKRQEMKKKAREDGGKELASGASESLRGDETKGEKKVGRKQEVLWEGGRLQPSFPSRPTARRRGGSGSGEEGREKW